MPEITDLLRNNQMRYFDPMGVHLTCLQEDAKELFKAIRVNESVVGFWFDPFVLWWWWWWWYDATRLRGMVLQFARCLQSSPEFASGLHECFAFSPLAESSVSLFESNTAIGAFQFRFASARQRTIVRWHVLAGWLVRIALTSFKWTSSFIML